MHKPAAITALLVLVAATALADDTRIVRKQVEIRPDGRVSLETFKGTVHVRTWNQPKVDIVATIAPDPSGDKQDERVELTEVRVSSSSGTVDIESDYSEASRVREGFFGTLFGVTGGTMPFVNYEIQMPATASLEIEDHKSNLTVAGLGGELTIETHKGIAKITAQSGPVHVDTHKGTIDVDFASITRPSSFETHKGTITLRIAAGARFDVDAVLDDDDAGFNSDFPMTIERSGSEGSVKAHVNGGGPLVRVETHKGAIRFVRK
ncbi:MAG: DUF4097 family beta strand repeat-containing protein [Thermoanaerobaculia bacterium]|jgi:hypothetical protein